MVSVIVKICSGMIVSSGLNIVLVSGMWMILLVNGSMVVFLILVIMIMWVLCVWIFWMFEMILECISVEWCGDGISMNIG